MLEFITPNWPAPPQVKAYTTTRQGGYSQAPFAQFNLADHVSDDPDAVSKNRQGLSKSLQLPAEPSWLQQVHGTNILSLGSNQQGCTADASIATKPRQVCAVLTADCLPVLFCDRAGTRVAAVHAGWRGLASGILQATVQKLAVPFYEILVWFGPAIGPQKFEVGKKVYDTFTKSYPLTKYAFHQIDENRWLANIYFLARECLDSVKVTRIYGGKFCTYTEAERFFSYRRDGGITGRMASLIWINDGYANVYF